jgi:hypothetical protein
MFSKPLAYPSTLDRRPPSCATRERRPTWRGFGARASCTSRKKRMQKPKRIADAHFVLVRRSLSPSGGASIQFFVFFKLGITSCSCRSIAFRNNEGDPVGRPRLARNAASDLACRPPSEGYELAGREPGIAVLAWQDPSGRRRFGEVHRGVNGVCHRFPPRPRIEHPTRLRKGSEELLTSASVLHFEMRSKKGMPPDETTCRITDTRPAARHHEPDGRASGAVQV